MELNEYIKEAGAIAEEKGFHESLKIVDKMMNSSEFTKEEARIIGRAIVVQKIALIMTELCEFIESHRKSNIENMNEEIADAFIRLFDFAALHVSDIEEEIRKKMDKNKNRPRLHGKLY